MLRWVCRWVDDPNVNRSRIVQQYASMIRQASTTCVSRDTYVCGQDVWGTELRSFQKEPLISAPLVCQLCDASFVFDADFRMHKQKEHCGEAEYRKRVLYLMTRKGCKPITGQEKRIMVQNFSHFQQFSRAGSGGNTFFKGPDVARTEAACAICAQKDWIEHRYKLSLFGTAPEMGRRTMTQDDSSDDEEWKQHIFQKVEDVYFIQNPLAVHALLDVDRYCTRWPQIPKEELHASSVQHPEMPSWRWLLHSRRVPFQEATGTCPEMPHGKPPCAGIGDVQGLVWACKECIRDLCIMKPKMPLAALANDNWIGREKLHVREASAATKMLASLARCCWKQVRLGKGDPSIAQQGISGNTIFFAQPTAEVPCMELPPSADALVDSFNILITRSLQDLSHASWATVKRSEYMKIIKERQQECPAFAHVKINEEASANLLPDEGVPLHVSCCTEQVEGSSNAPVRLLGPASRAPETSRLHDAGEDSEGSDKEVGGAEQPADGPSCTRTDEEMCAETVIAVDPVHDANPVRKLQALKGTIETLENQAKEVLRNESRATVADSSGILHPVTDEGGRDVVQSLVLDVQHVAKAFDERTQHVLEQSQLNAEQQRPVSPAALAIPVHGPLSSFDARTWPACFVEFWYGDGAPNLERDRPMLFEQVARRLLNLEELEYHMAQDQVRYVASNKSRFNTPELIAVLGDVIRRLRLLRSTKATIGRKGFGADLRMLANASSDDFLQALHLAKKSETIASAAYREDMPPKVRSALRTVLLSTSDVPGTEGRKTQLRYNGHGNNLLFGASGFFVTPNFADTYSPLVHALHKGPSSSAHLDIGRVPTLSGPTRRLQGKTPISTVDFQEKQAVQKAIEVVSEPELPTLQSMHRIGAEDPRGQAKFFLLMMELHYRFIFGLDRLHVGRLCLARCSFEVQDEVAWSLQPSIMPGTIDLQSPFETQGRGSNHGHAKGHCMIGPTLEWLRKIEHFNLAGAAKLMQDDLLETAQCVQYEAAREPAAQLGVHVREEPFSARQQRQSRMDGGEDDDGSRRDLVKIAPPVEQPHIERARLRASAENALPSFGASAFKNLPLTGAFQSSFPAYRLRSSLGELGRDAPQLPSVSAALQGDACSVTKLTHRCDDDLFVLDEEGKAQGVLKKDGVSCFSVEELETDARAWAECFGLDAFNNHCVNHEHDCTETCIKYVKRRLEAKESLKSHKVPSCRFWFFRVVSVRTERGLRRVRRRGKPLLQKPCICDTDERNQEHRCLVKREQPFRSTTNDVCQVCDRCNVDFQFLLCAPHAGSRKPPSCETAGGTDETVQVKRKERGRLSKKTMPVLPSTRVRLTKKTTVLTKAGLRRAAALQRQQLLFGIGSFPDEDLPLLKNYASAFAKAYAMDFYITKYQNKMMESLTPLFLAMTHGIQRLERQEQLEEEEAKNRSEETEALPEEQRHRQTLEDLSRRARRVCIRLASMANRCFWLSASEVAIHILTDGDCLQTHTNQRIFTRQLQWIMQECKRSLNKEPLQGPLDDTMQTVQAVRLTVSTQDGSNENATDDAEQLIGDEDPVAELFCGRDLAPIDNSQCALHP